MKIKLAILDKDQCYLNRITAVFESNYSDKLEIYSFSDEATAMAELKISRVNILLASETFTIDPSSIPAKCGFAYFVESPDIESYRDQKTICKYQKAEMIYKEILGIYSEKMSDSVEIKYSEGGSAKVIMFASAGGGVGGSTAAAACSKFLAGFGKMVLYIDMEEFGCADAFFHGEGTFDFSDVLFMLKSKKGNLPLKLESAVKRDNSGAFFFSPAKTALDMREMNAEDISTLLSEIKMIGSYEYLILDADFRLNGITEKIMELAETIVMVSDGSEISNLKFMRAYQAVELMDEQKSRGLSRKITILYNKFSNKTGKVIDDDTIVTLGGIPKIEHATTEQTIDQIEKMNIFQKLL